jgi:hypothetical protein
MSHKSVSSFGNRKKDILHKFYSIQHLLTSSFKEYINFACILVVNGKGRVGQERTVI